MAMTKKGYVPDFLMGANNVYRTKQYIVKQQVTVVMSANGDSYIISNDTFYLRNPKRDFEFALAFQKRQNLNGKRLPSSTYTRKYVD
ncbi:MAG: hypothetical protein IJ398_04085 [Clostridia bacterium]|nr:hypothetical protein [Clostridia bacterium]